MKRKLFLTGPMGCGKSTAIATAIGDKLPEFGGFLTKRLRNTAGQAIAFYIESPDGKLRQTFLDLTAGTPEVNLDAFGKYSNLLLKPVEIATPVCELARNDKAYILDEIGGLELLNPAFMAALDGLLASDTPIIGVVKGAGPASAMIRRLGLAEEYETAADRFREKLRNDPDTLVYDCGKWDAEALRLADAWVKEYVHE